MRRVFRRTANLANVTARIRALDEQLEVSLFRRTSRGAVLKAAGDAMLARRVDGAFVAGPIDHPELTAETIFREEIVILSAGALSIERYLRGGDVRIIVLRAGRSYRLMLESWLAREGVMRAWTIPALTAQR